MRLLHKLALAFGVAGALALSAPPAHAGFVVPLIVGFIGLTGVAATVASVVIGVGLSIGVSYIAAKLLAKTPDQPTVDPIKDVGGTSIDIQVAADVPMSLIVGRAALAGSLVYANTFGKRGDIDNSDLIEIIALADHPCTALYSGFIEGVPATFEDSGTDRGLLVNGYTGQIDKATVTAESLGSIGIFSGVIAGVLNQQLSDQGKLQTYGSLIAVKFFDGTQTTADSFAVANLGTASDQPWTSDFIGTGVGYVRVHSIYDREKVPGRMRWRWVVDGIKLYDPRLDTTAGGSGGHRYNDISTHAWTQNLAVIAYNIVRGIYIEDSNGDRQFFYGIEGTAADQVPFDIWVAAMNECDVSMPTADGGTEAQYTAGGEITLDTEPLEAIKALLRASGGRMVEIGGVYKLYLGAPGAPVIAFDDGSLLADQDDKFKPILPLEQRINYITGQYTSPQDGWLPKIAPPRGNSDWEDEDGRRLPADLNTPMVQSGTQMQRLQLQMLKRARQQRSHVVPLPPQAMIVEPGDSVTWNSVRNGYSEKLFEVQGVDYDPNLNVLVSILEVDPADYDYDADTEELPESDGHIISKRPEPKVIGGFSVSAFTYLGDVGTARPAIRLEWDDPEDDDASIVRWQVRLNSDHSNVETGSSDEPTAGALVIVGGLQPVTHYQVRARFESFNGYGSEWSLWLDVTTLDIRFTAADFEAGLRDFVTRQFKEALGAIDKIEQLIASVAAQQDEQNWIDKKRVRADLVAQAGDLTASISEVRTVAVGAYDALAVLQTTVEATFAEQSASITENATAVASINGKLAAQWTVSLNVNGYVSGVKAYNSGLTSSFIISADIFQVAFPGGVTGGSPVPVFQIANVNGAAKVVFRGDMFGDGAITARSLSVASLSAMTANLGDANFSGTLRSANGLLRLEATNNRLVISDG